MNKVTELKSYKIAKGELVTVASAQDIPVRLEEDVFVKQCQVSISRTGEVIAVLAGVRFSVLASQLKPVFKEQPKPATKDSASTDFDPDFDCLEGCYERIEPWNPSDGRNSSHVIWYGGFRRPSSTGSRVLRGRNSLS